MVQQQDGKAGKRKASKYAVKFARRVKIANKIGTSAWFQMVKPDGKKGRNLPHAMPVLHRMLSS